MQSGVLVDASVGSRRHKGGGDTHQIEAFGMEGGQTLLGEGNLRVRWGLVVRKEASPYLEDELIRGGSRTQTGGIRLEMSEAPSVV